MHQPQDQQQEEEPVARPRPQATTVVYTVQWGAAQHRGTVNKGIASIPLQKNLAPENNNQISSPRKQERGGRNKMDFQGGGKDGQGTPGLRKVTTKKVRPTNESLITKCGTESWRSQRTKRMESRDGLISKEAM